MGKFKQKEDKDMYPTQYPFANNHFQQIPSYTPMNVNIPEIQYVNSPESADSFNLPPNKTVVLFNQNNDEFYIVQTDASGSKTRNDFTFKAKAKNKPVEYVTKDEFNELKEMVAEKSKAPKKATEKATEVSE